MTNQTELERAIGEVDVDTVRGYILHCVTTGDRPTPDGLFDHAGRPKVGVRGEAPLPAHVLAEVQRLLDEAARRALADELHIDPALIPLRAGEAAPADRRDDDLRHRGADDPALDIQR
jgi:hypothetical protein